MEHVRIVELQDLEEAIRGIEAAPSAWTERARTLAVGMRRALILGNLSSHARAALDLAAAEAGLERLGGAEDRAAAAARVLIGDDEELRALAVSLRSAGLPALAAGVRRTIEEKGRREFVLPFADGGTMELGRSTRVMGIVNVTPDSFSDGGRFFRLGDAMAAAARMADEGADFIDVGGESTRPGAVPVDVDEEIRRVVPVVDAVKRRLGIRVSVDTTRATVARRAIDAGGDMINDVSAFSDPEMLPLLRATGVPAVAMHMRGTPRTMQRDTRYEDLMGEIVEFLRKTVERAEESGVPGGRILVDPGIGFGKSVEGNLQILRHLPALRGVGCPILVGASRKSFLGAILDVPATDRLEGSLAVAALAAWQGAHVVRAHDVAATVRAVRTADAIRGA